MSPGVLDMAARRMATERALRENRAICADCGMPQPDDGSLHMEECPGHDSRFCVVCQEVYEDSKILSEG